jgi:hypothetical protein
MRTMSSWSNLYERSLAKCFEKSFINQLFGSKIELDPKDLGKSWLVKVKFSTDEIRKSSDILESTLDFIICK